MNPARILIVEDEGIIALDIKGKVAAHGFDVVDTAASGEEAVASVARLHPDLVLMDITLGGAMDGIEAAARIRRIAAVPIVYLTAATSTDVMRRAMVTEPHGYLVKPCNERELWWAIEFALYKHRMEDERRRAEDKIRQLNEELERRVADRTDQLQAALTRLQAEMTERLRLEQQVQEAAERERQTIGRDLHDGLGQLLTGIAFRIQALDNALADRSRPEAKGLDDLIALISQATAQTRDMARLLFPAELWNSGLPAALTELVTATGYRFKVACTLSCDPRLNRLPPETAIHLYRIVQEALTNAIRHGSATRIAVRLRMPAGGLHATIRDNGCGLPSSATPDGFGLQSMRYRARLLGGELRVRNRPRGGLQVTFVAVSDQVKPNAPAVPQQEDQGKD